MAFNYNRKNLTYADAEKQANKQLDPLYNRAVSQVHQQRYANDTQAGNVAAARGLGRSGLAADALNKNAIAAQSQVGDMAAQRASRAAEMAQSLVNRDQDFGLQSRAQAYQEYMGQQGLSRDDRDFNYQKSMNDRNFTYQKGRDAIGDKQWQQQFNFQQTSYADDKKWREHTYNNMSAAEKANLEWARQQYGEDAAWRLYEMEYQGEMQKSMSNAELEYYKSIGLGDFLP